MCKRIICLFLITLTILMSVPVSVYSAMTDEFSKEDNARAYGYSIPGYTDIFYVYDASYMKPQTLRDYVKDTYNINFKIYNDYCESDTFWWTEFKTALNASTNLREYFELLSSSSDEGLDFTYANALDNANAALFTSLLNGYDGYQFGALSKFASQFETLADMFEQNTEFLKTNVDVLTPADIYELYIHDMLQLGILKNITNDHTSQLLGNILANADKINTWTKIAGGVTKGIEVICIALVIEDVRLEVLEEVIANTESGSAINDGFKRLRNQLEHGFISYFYNQYLLEEGFKLLVDTTLSVMSDYILGKGSLYSVVSAAARAASFVVFDVIFKVPDIDDMMLQYVLSEYASDLYDVLFESNTGLYVTAFDEYFETDRVRDFEYLFNMYTIATEQALEASKKISLKSNRDELYDIIDKYDSFCYDEYINDIKLEMMEIKDTDRKMKYYGNFVWPADIKFHDHLDYLKDGYFYILNDTINACVYPSGNASLPAGGKLNINGHLYVSQGSTFTVYGDLNVSNYIGVESTLTVARAATLTTDKEVYAIAGNGIMSGNYRGYINVYGTFNIGTDLFLRGSSYQSSAYYSGISVLDDDAKVYIGGNFEAVDVKCCDISAGTVIFNGNKGVQNISNLSVHNIEVTNPYGVNFINTLYLNGNFDLHGNPSTGAGIEVSAGATFTEGSDYRSIGVPRSTSYTLENYVKANFSVNGTLTIPEGTSAGIDGNIRLTFSTYPYKSSGYLYIYGELELTGDLTLVKESYQSSYWYSYLVMNTPGSKLYLGGDLKAGGTECFNITDGTIIFNGKRQQNISYLMANNVEVLNPYGIKYLTSVTVRGLYDLNANPLDNNGYSTQITGTTRIASGSDYKTLYIPYGTTFNAEGDFKANISINGVLTVQNGKSARIDGNVFVSVVRYNLGQVNVYGELEVTGDLELVRDSYQSSYNYSRFNLYDGAVFTLGGDFIAYGTKNVSLNGGTVIFNGSDKQTISYLNAPTLVVKNHSYEGVYFNTSISPRILFDHNNCVTNAYGTFADYDGDGIKDNIDSDPKAGPNTVPVLSADGYFVTVTAASEINHIRYAKGVYTTSNEIRNAADCVNIDAKLISANTKYGSYVTEMPDGGVYSFWVRTADGDTYILNADLSYMTPKVKTNGVKVTVDNLYGAKDFFIARGTHQTYTDVKANNVMQVSSNKLGNAHSYTYTLPDYGEYTVLVRYNDTKRANEIIHFKLRVLEPVFSMDGLQLTVGNLNDIKVIRVAYGDYNKSGDIKRAEGCRNFTAKYDIKGADSYMIQFREGGLVSVAVEYNNGYVKIYKCEIEKKTPTVKQNENTVVFGELDGLAMVRYAPGEYYNSADIKRANGSKVKKSDTIVDGKITITLKPGIYSFCVQYKDESYNYYIIEIEDA